MQKPLYCHAAVLVLALSGVSAAHVLVHCRVVTGGIMHALVTWTEYKLTSDADQWQVLLVLSCLSLPCPALLCPVEACLALSYPALPCLAPSCPALPYPTLPCPALPCPCLTLSKQQLLLTQHSAPSGL